MNNRVILYNIIEYSRSARGTCGLLGLELVAVGCRGPPSPFKIFFSFLSKAQLGRSIAIEGATRGGDGRKAHVLPGPGGDARPSVRACSLRPEAVQRLFTTHHKVNASTPEAVHPKVFSRPTTPEGATRGALLGAHYTPALSHTKIHWEGHSDASHSRPQLTIIISLANPLDEVTRSTCNWPQ